MYSIFMYSIVSLSYHKSHKKRYANELRYALIHAVFVTPTPVEIYHIRHTLRIPRRIKPAHGSFDIKLYKRLKKSIDEEKLNNKKRKGKYMALQNNRLDSN